MSLKWQCVRNEAGGYYALDKGVAAPVRLFLSEQLYADTEEALYQQVKNATEYPGVRDVVVTPDAHVGSGVPVGCVIATEGTLCQAPVGYDIGCGMLAFRSDVDRAKAKDKRLRQKFADGVMSTVGMGLGKGSGRSFSDSEYEEILRHGAAALGYERDNVEADYHRVDDAWTVPKGPKHKGRGQLGSLGGGNHFCEIQHDQDGKLWGMIHTGSRAFGNGLASHFIHEGRRYLQSVGVNMRAGTEAVYYTEDNPLYHDYRNAVAAGANYAIVNRLLIWEAVARVFRDVFGAHPELVYELSHNMVQEEFVPELGGKYLIHRKGATRAFPAGHPMLEGTKWAQTGHPVLIPGSMGDKSYILFAEPGVSKSLYSVNHGCGRAFSRGEAKQRLVQRDVNARMQELGVLVNGGGNVPLDESPDCYKRSSDVIAAVLDAGLARVAYKLTPMINLKGTDER